MPFTFHQSPPQLALDWERPRVCDHVVDFYVVTNSICARYLYYQMFGIDACFRFKRRQVSSYERDPELGPGYAYLVAWDSYCEYLRRFTDQEEVRHPNPAPGLR